MEHCDAGKQVHHIIWGVMVVRGLLCCTLAFLISGQSGDFQAALRYRLAHHHSPSRIQSPVVRLYPSSPR